MSRPIRAYLAGPDVFLPDGFEVGARKKELCAKHYIEGLYPLDAPFRFGELPPAEWGRHTFALMLEMMERCDAGIVNLSPFRGPSMDVGTAVEIGYLHGRGKPVFGYSNETRDYAARVPEDGMLIENFGLADIVMCEGPMLLGGRRVHRVPSPEGALAAWEAFEACVREVAAWAAGRGR